MILPEWTARKDASVSPPPAGSFLCPLEGRNDCIGLQTAFERRQTDALMGDVSPSPATGRYFEELFGIYFGGYPFVMNAPEAVGA